MKLFMSKKHKVSTILVSRYKMSQYKMSMLVGILFAAFSLNVFGGIPANMLVLTEPTLKNGKKGGAASYKTASKLEYGDKVISLKKGKLKLRKINCILHTTVSSLVEVTSEKGNFTLSEDHLVFDPHLNMWIKAKDLTPDNMRKVLRMTRDRRNYLGPDDYGNQWYGKIENGGQIWSRVRDGKIAGAGKNPIPREYNSKTGLCIS